MIDAASRPMRERIARLEAMQSEFVSTTEAVRITGKSDDTLRIERDRPGTLIVYKMEGRTGKQPRYCRASLVRYNESRPQRRGAGIDRYPNR